MADNTVLLMPPTPDDENNNNENRLDKPDKTNELINTLLEITRNNALSAASLIQHVSNHDQQLNLMTEEIGRLSDRVTQREQDEVINSRQKKALKRAVGSTVYKLLGLRKNKGRLSQEDKAMRNVYGSLFFARLYSELYERFEVETYEDIKAADFADAQAFIKTWEPCEGTSSLRREAEENWKLNHPGQSVNTYLGVLLT